MKDRVAVGVLYVAVILGGCALKAFFPTWGSYFFDALFALIAAIGSFEFLRACKVQSKVQRFITIAFCSAIVPVYVLTRALVDNGVLTMFDNAQWVMVIFLCVGAMALMFALVFDKKHTTFTETAYCMTCMLYAGMLCAICSAVNHLTYNSVSAMFVLVMVVPVTDAFALFTGVLLKGKFPAKLAPHISPNKTVIGSLGGLAGGVVAAVVAYYAAVLVNQTPTFLSGEQIPLWVFLIIGFLTAIASQVGDLFESAVKRECGIKDMGDILRGHGGMLDRFDSTLFAGMTVFACFWIFV